MTDGTTGNRGMKLSNFKMYTQIEKLETKKQTMGELLQS